MGEELVYDWSYDVRTYGDPDKASRVRVGPFLTSRLHDMGVTSFIGGRGVEAERLRKIQARVRANGNRCTIAALSFLNDLCRGYHLPHHVCEEAAAIARRLAAAHDRRRSQLPNGLCEAFAAAAVLAAAARNGIDLGDDIGGFEPTFLAKLLWRNGITFSRDTGATIGRIINAVAERLGAAHIIADAVAVARAFRDRVVGHNPRSVAAAALYIAAKINNVYLSQYRLSAEIGVTDAAIRYTLRKMGVKVVYRAVRGGREVARYEWVPSSKPQRLLELGDWLRKTGLASGTEKIRLEKRIGETIEVIVYV